MSGMALPILAVAVTIVFALSLTAFIAHDHPFRQLLAFNVMGSSIFAVFGLIARRNWNTFSDPVPQAIVITGIVVGVSATAFALTLLNRIQEEPSDSSLHGDGEEQ